MSFNQAVASNSNAQHHLNAYINAGGVDSTTVPEGATGSEFSTSTASSVTLGDTPTESEIISSQEPISQPSSDMLIIITGTVCGIIILLLLIAVTTLALILVTKSRRQYVLSMMFQ